MTNINKTEVDGGVLVHGVESKGKSVLDIPELTEEEYKAIYDKVSGNTDLHPFLADRPGRIYILKSNTFKALFSTTYVKDLWKITPTVKDIIVSESCNVRISKNLYAVRIALVAWFYHLESNGRNDDEVRLQEYVNFIRLARNEFYNVDFKINKRKFISGVKRSTTMAQYLEMIKV